MNGTDERREQLLYFFRSRCLILAGTCRVGSRTKQVGQTVMLAAHRMLEDIDITNDLLSHLVVGEISDEIEIMSQQLSRQFCV